MKNWSAYEVGERSMSRLDAMVRMRVAMAQVDFLPPARQAPFFMYMRGPTLLAYAKANRMRRREFQSLKRQIGWRKMQADRKRRGLPAEILTR